MGIEKVTPGGATRRFKKNGKDGINAGLFSVHHYANDDVEKMRAEELRDKSNHEEVSSSPLACYVRNP